MSAATAIEDALIAAGVSRAISAAVPSIEPTASAKFSTVNTAIA